MKKTVLIFWVVMASINLFAQNEKEIFYYYQGEKIYLKENRDKVLIKLSKETDKSSFLNSLQTAPNYRISNSKKDVGDFVILESQGNISDQLKQQNLKIYQKHNDVLCANFMFTLNKKDDFFGFTDEFIVKLNPSTLESEFLDLINENKCEIIKQDKYDSDIFIVKTTKATSRSALEMSVNFFETTLFEFSEPNFIQKAKFYSNDPLYNEQWALNNTGQSGGTINADISIEEAWDITQGRPDIRIAVIDEGVELTHPDLVNNLVAGYDASGNGTNGGPVPGHLGHGTNCAGIIAAEANNNLGIAGVANKCSIIPVSIDLSGGFSDVEAADAINWAWSQGNADIISNSWGGIPQSSYIDQAIFNAFYYGRNSLGTVVLFAGGNENASVISYPANHILTVAVGATDMCDQRLDPSPCDGNNVAGGSNRGSALDIVAPGHKIKTTHSNSSYIDFGGTSAATPFAAGVAGLILSVNPCLKPYEVKQILTLSCDKPTFISSWGNNLPICYRSYPNSTFGTWNNEMGYGRINAYNAVKFAHSQNITTVSNVGGSSQGTGGSPFTWILGFNACSGEAAAAYIVYRYEVYKYVNFPYSSSPSIVLNSNGFSAANPNSGSFWAQATNVTNTSARLSTFVYSVISTSGQIVGWVPNHPLDVRFTYSVVDNVTPKIFLQNEIVSSGTQNYSAIDEIWAGRNVTSSKPQGDYVVQGTANVTLRAGNQIIFKPGTVISPSQGGSFHASVEPFFTCTQYPMGRIANPNLSNDKQGNDYQEPFIKDYKVSFEESNKVLLDEKIELKIYPNPSINNSTIEYSLSKSSKVVILVYDLKGREMVNLKNRDVHGAGKYKITLELNDYPSGIYIVKMTTNQGTISNQLIKQ